MHVFISSVNEQLCWEENTPHPHDYHDPPHAPCVGFRNDVSPPRRLAGLARSGPWKATPARVGFPGQAIRRRTSPWVVRFDGWNIRRGKDCQQRYLRDEDRNPGQEICALPMMDVADSQLEAFAFAGVPKGYFVSHGPLYAGPIGLNLGGVLAWLSAVPFSSARRSQLIEECYTSTASAHAMVPTGRRTENPNFAILALGSGLSLNVHFVSQLWIISTNAPAQMDIWQCLSMGQACQARARWTVWIFELGRWLNKNGMLQ